MKEGACGGPFLACPTDYFLRLVVGSFPSITIWTCSLFEPGGPTCWYFHMQGNGIVVDVSQPPFGPDAFWVLYGWYGSPEAELQNGIG